MSNYEASGANYSLWELESAGSRSAKDNLWDASAKAQHVGTDFLTFFFFWLVPPFFPLSALQGEAIREKSLRARVLSTLKPNCFSSPQQSCQDSLHHYSSTFYCAKCHRFPWQQPLTYFKKLFYIYMCAACGCHLVYKPERGQAWSGCAAGSPRSTLCSLESTLHRVHQTVIIIFPPWAPAQNPGQTHPGVTLREDFWPALPWHGATALSQIYFLPPCGFPKWQIRGSAMEKLFGIFIHGKTSEQGVSGIDALSETSINRQLQIQRCWDL